MVESYIQALITSAGVIMGVWGFVKVLRDIKKSNDEEVKRRDRVDKAVKIVEENAEKWDKGLSDIYGERETIVKRFDERLDEVMGALNENGFIIQEDGKVPVTDNFYVDEFNLHFVYPPYSITCYARGEADVTVPYYMLDQSDLATPYLNELLEHYTR